MLLYKLILILYNKNWILENSQNGDVLYNQMSKKSDSGQYIYLKLYEMLKKEIMIGAYQYGSRLPSKRTLAEEMGTSVIPVEHAYELLCEEGYAEARARSGHFVIYRKDDFIFNQSEWNVEPFHSNRTHEAKSDFPYTVLAKTMRRVLLDYQEKIMIKSPNQGCPELCQALSRYLARSCGIEVRPEQIIVGSGAEYLYGLVVKLLGTNRVFGIEIPSYEKIRKVYHAHGVQCELLKLGPDGIQTVELEQTKATVLHVTPFHSFPSGITASASKRMEYLRWAEKHGGFIIEDNYDAELTVSKKNDDTIFSLSEKGLVIYLNTFSGTIAPSIRVGYMVLPERLLEDFQQKLGFYSCTVPVFEQYVLAELLQSGDFERHINRVRRKRRRTSESDC